jgi:radical SAM superfamily enzyme YgiQ (UPF0313 family)
MEYDVLLTYPSEKFSIFEPMVPTGLASMGAVLEEAGYSVKTVDFTFYKGDFRRDLKKWQPAIIGIGGTTPTRKASFLTAHLSKQVLPNVPVVYGGVHASFTAKDTLENVPQIDYVIKGEGELPFLKLCNKFIRRGPVNKNEVNGLCFRTRDGIVENKPKRLDNLDDLPMPARHFFKDNYKMRLDFCGLEADYLITSRGCPASCTFCSASSMFPGGVRFRSAGNMKGLKIFDSTFTASEYHVYKFCDMIKHYGLLWECEIRADTVGRNLLALMKDAGCYYINMGLETTNKRLLKSLAKNISVRQVERVLAWCGELDIKAKVFLSYGHPGQTYEECLKDVRYVKDKKGAIDFYANTIGMRIYPGTALEKRARRQGVIAPDFSWARFKPPFRNLLLLEPGDTLILEQKQLSIFRLFSVMIRLIFQKTVLSSDYIRKITFQTVAALISMVFKRIRYVRHNLERGALLVAQMMRAHRA